MVTRHKLETGERLQTDATRQEPQTEGTEKRYDVFLSHSSPDKAVVEQIALRLRKRRIKVFLDKWHIQPGDAWMEELEIALKSSRTCAVFLGPNDMRPWHHEEMRAALQMPATQPEFRVIPVLLPRATPPAAGDVPLFLSRLSWTDFSGPEGVQNKDVFDAFVAAIRGKPILRPGGKKKLSVPGPERQATTVIPSEVIIDCRPELHRHREFVGREWLQKRAREWMGSQPCGYFLVIGGPGVGKSAFMAQLIAHDPQPVVFHFIKRGMGNWDEPEAFWLSIATQLQRKHRLSADAIDHSDARTAFVTTLQHVSQKRRNSTPEVIYLDGLDEAFGPAGRFAALKLLEVLPRMLPEGVLFVLTSRPGEFLADLNDPIVAEVINLEDEAQDNQRDVYAYLAQQNQTRRLGLTPEFLERLVTASEGLFIVAVLYMQRPEQLREWQQDVALLPQGFTGWLAKHWQSVITAAKQHGIEEAVVRGALGLLAVARKPLSLGHLNTFLRFSGESNTPHVQKAPFGFLQVSELARHSETILRLASEFFDPLDPEQGVDAPYRFFHSQFREFIADKLTDVERQDCHRLLATSCQEYLWHSGATGVVKDYALQHRLGHWIEAEQWQQVTATFADLGFMVERCQRFGFAEIYRDAWLASQHQGLSPDWHEAFSSWEQFLRSRSERLRSFANAYIQEVINEFLPSALPAWTEAFAGVEPTSAFAPVPFLCKTSGPSAMGGSGQTMGSSGHTAEVLAIAVSPEGKRIASASQDQTIKVWDSETGRLVADCVGHANAVSCVIFSPNGKALISGSEDGSVKVWDPDTGYIQAEGDKKHSAGVTSIAVSPDGRWLASSSQDRTVQVWEASGRTVTTYKGHGGIVTCVAFTTDGRAIISGSDDGAIKIWQTANGSLLTDCIGHTTTVSSLVLTRDGQRIVSGSGDGTVKVWDVHSGKLIASTSAQPRPVTCVAVSPAGQKVTTGAADGALKIWDLTSGQLLVECVGHTGYVTSIEWSSTEPLLVSGSEDGTVKIWGTEDGQLLATGVGHTSAVSSVAIVSDPPRVVSGSHDASVKIWDANTGGLLATCEGFLSETSSLVVSSDGQHAVAGKWGGAVNVWEVSTGQEVKSFTHNTASVTSVDCTADGTRVAWGTWDGTATVWDIAADKRVAEFYHDGRVTTVTLTPDGQRLVCGSTDHSIKLWDIARQEVVVTCAGHADTVTCVTVAPSGKRLASGGADKTVKLWDCMSGKLQSACSGHASVVNCLAFAPDEQKLASGDLAGNVHIWDVRTGKLLAVCRGHTDTVTSLVFIPGTKWLISGSEDSTVKVWDLTSGRCVNSLFFNRIVRAVMCLKQSPTTLLVIDQEQRVFTYDIAAV